MIEGTYHWDTLKPDEYCSALVDYLKKEIADTKEDIQKKENGNEEKKMNEISPLLLPCVILAGGKTACTAEELALLARNAGILLIGETTAGVNGSVIADSLRNGWELNFTGSDSYRPQGETIWNCGVKPDILVCMTIEDYMSGIDNVLQKGIQYIEQEVRK